MDDILDAQEAIERELFQLEDGDSSSEENETEVEKLLYSVSHYAPDLSSENSLAFDKVDSIYPETSQSVVSTENEGQISLPGQLPKRKRKSISKRYYEMLDKQIDIQVCKTCKKQGHTKEKCVEWKKEIVCYNCNEMGHFSRECRKKKDEVCFNCNEIGHKYRLCPNTLKDIVCFNCNEKGHFAVTCTEYKNKTSLVCTNGRPKDGNNEYIEERKSLDSKTNPLRNGVEMEIINLKCHCCEKRGHFARECPDAIDKVENRTEKKQSASEGLPLYENKWILSPLGSCTTSSKLEINLNLGENKKGSERKFGIYHSPICRNTNEINCEISETEDDSKVKSMVSEKQFGQILVDNLSESVGGEQLGKNTAGVDFRSSPAGFMMIKSTDNDKNNPQHGHEASEVLKTKKKKKKSAKKNKNQDCSDVTFSREGSFQSKKDHGLKQSSNANNDREVILSKKKNSARDNTCMTDLSLSNGSREDQILVEGEKQDEFKRQLDIVDLRANNKRKKKSSNVSKENHDVTLSKEKQSFPDYSPLMDLGLNEQVANKKYKAKNAVDVSSCFNAEKSTEKVSVQKILDQETLRNLSRILLESSGDETDYCDPGGIADHLTSPDINLDAESVVNEDVISTASDCSIEECFFECNTKGNRDATYYDPTALCEEHLQLYGLNESPSNHLENEKQASSLRKRKPNPETSPAKKQKVTSHKRKGNILGSFKKNFSCGTQRSVRTSPTCYGSKTKRKREERGFVFKKKKK